MGYALGVDLGTTYTAAAVSRDGRVEIATLGNRSAAVPSVVLLRDDETILTGDAASRRGVTEPDRVAREFKRRVGDTTPIFLGGAPYSAETLMGKLLRWVVDEVAQREGGPPDATVVSHPANWGAYKKDLLEQAMRQADLDNATTITEPEAAAIHYASTERVDPGDVVAVYDLGGGTFDAAVLRKTATGFELLGQPEGVERLGGIDFDAAAFAHVVRALDGAVEALDEDDPAARAAVARLRQECVDAKEALSTDTDVSIPVLLPDLQTEVRLTRAEFEAMVRPTLVESTHAMHRALRSAGVQPDEVKAVLLVGGSSRIPLVVQLVGAEFGRPVAVDAHPKHSIALGAALAAAGDANGRAGATAVSPGPAAAGAAVAAGAAGGVAGAAAAGAMAAADEPTQAAPSTSSPPSAGEPTQPLPTAEGAGQPPQAGERFYLDDDDDGGGGPRGGDRDGRRGSRPWAAIVGVVIIAAVVLGGGAALLASRGGGGDNNNNNNNNPTTTAPETTTPDPVATTTPRTTAPTTSPTTTTSTTTTTTTTSPEPPPDDAEALEGAEAPAEE
jgi:molecular chaperone DnaK